MSEFFFGIHLKNVLCVDIYVAANVNKFHTEIFLIILI